MGKDKELRKIVFLDANVIISGTFFEGNESKLISLEDIDLYTSDIVVKEAKEVAIKKFKSLKTEDKRIALMEIERSLIDFVSIVEEKDYLKKVGEARKLIRKEKDSKILAAVLAVKPDYFVTGDKDFHTFKMKQVVPVRHTKEVLEDLGILSRT